LPNGWNFAKVGDFCTENIGNLSENDKFETILYLDTGSINENYIAELKEYNISTDEIPSRAKRKVANGDIIYSTVRPNLRHYGLLQNPPDNLIVSTGFAVLHNNGLGISNEFLFMWLTNDSVLEYLQAIAENSVSTYPSLNVADLMNVKIVVPDTETLNNMSHFLSTVFIYISENNKQIQKLCKVKDTLLAKLLLNR
jgi:type I restriction enzyme S subunit